jgi:hypothetical protein
MEDRMPTYILASGTMEGMEKKLDALWGQLRTNEGLLEDLGKAGISPFDIPPGSRGDLIRIETPRQGLVVEAGAAVAIVLAPVGRKVLTDLWTKILLPRLQRHLKPLPRSAKAPGADDPKRARASRRGAKTKTRSRHRKR